MSIKVTFTQSDRAPITFGMAILVALLVEIALVFLGAVTGHNGFFDVAGWVALVLAVALLVAVIALFVISIREERAHAAWRRGER